MVISIYTDGSCLSNPNGKGGWAYICINDDMLFVDSGNNNSTTNNRMELKAVIEAIKIMEKDKEYIIYTDSQLTINCGMKLWNRKSNIDLWDEYNKISKDKNFTFKYVKAHNGDKYNELADKLAKEEAYKIK